MNEARCHFCGASFRNRQAVRAHLRRCATYRGRQAKTGSRQGRLPIRTVPLGRPVPQADEPEAEVDRGDRTPPHVHEAQLRPPEHGMADVRALLAAHEKRRQGEAAEARKQKRRQLVQRVKDRVVGQCRSLGYTIPAETKAQALRDIERELSALPVDELPEWELVQLAEGNRDRLYGPVMRAQDEAQRVKDQSSPGGARRSPGGSLNSEPTRTASGRRRRPAPQRSSGTGRPSRMTRCRTWRDLDEQEQQRILQRVELD